MSTSPTASKPPSVKPHTRAICFSFTTSLLELLDQAALSAPIGDPECARLLNFRLAPHDHHWDVAPRTERRLLQVSTKLKYVVRHITLIVARDHSLLDLLREVQAECLGADYVPLKKGGASQT